MVYLLIKKKYNLKAILRLFLITLWFLLGFLWLILFGSILRGGFFRLTLKFFAKTVLRICGLKLTIEGCVPEERCRYANMLIISNHISWIDVFVIHAVGIPGIFIAKLETKRWFLVGNLIKNAKTIFIDREKKSSIKSVMQKSKKLLSEGNSIVFFPEGTTTDGKKILPFHTSLFSLFLDDPKTKILPILIKYKKNGSRSILPAYIGEMTLLDSIMQILNSEKLEANVTFIDCKFEKNISERYNKVKRKKELAGFIRAKMMAIL